MIKDKTIKFLLASALILLIVGGLGLGLVGFGVITLPQKALPDGTIQTGSGAIVAIERDAANVDIEVQDWANSDKTTEVTSGDYLYYTVNNVLVGVNETVSSTYTIAATTGDRVCAEYFSANYHSPGPSCIDVSSVRGQNLVIPTYSIPSGANGVKLAFKGNESDAGEVTVLKVAASSTDTVDSAYVKVNQSNKAFNFKGISIDYVVGTNITGDKMSFASPVTLAASNAEFRSDRNLATSASITFSKSSEDLQRLENDDDVYILKEAILLTQWDKALIPGMSIEADSDSCGSTDTNEEITLKVLDEARYKSQVNTLKYGMEDDKTTPLDVGSDDAPFVFECGYTA